MKTYEIRCKATWTELNGNLSLNELKSTLESYYNQDFWLDTDEVIKYCQFNNISLLDYFTEGHKFDNELTHIIERYEVLDNNGQIVSIDSLCSQLYNYWNFHWFYENNNPKFRITDDSCIYDSFFWSDLKENFNWQIIDVNSLVYGLLKQGQYNYVDMSATNNFFIEII